MLPDTPSKIPNPLLVFFIMKRNLRSSPRSLLINTQLIFISIQSYVEEIWECSGGIDPLYRIKNWFLTLLQFAKPRFCLGMYNI
ncbi:unnamed protein product [Rhizophagus irregularis]|nr:unnamed protein product [Rhizophagus irregularis]CAB5381204.1 unnamed protein product [Rhizophagus irregularis]